MKKLFGAILLLSSLNVLSSTHVEIQPGSRTIVDAGEQVTVSCTGESQSHQILTKVAECPSFNCDGSYNSTKRVLKIDILLSNGESYSTCAKLEDENKCKETAERINSRL